eukprot:CAMPEP_0194316512 /NCGR_PEP_ID=MMETSP0171-20130528/13307_1 /TAXON_ID=218684 /ORGANISM="Corethron pennatum, Strain L29A3" /LENGTH=126 /DNA_ID=CAMNT_0039072773 /DNA_START=402 /DNA_END=781 /DNA_ORIENTATION=+
MFGRKRDGAIGCPMAAPTSATVATLTMWTVLVSPVLLTPERVFPNWWVCSGPSFVTSDSDIPDSISKKDAASSSSAAGRQIHGTQQGVPPSAASAVGVPLPYRELPGRVDILSVVTGQEFGGRKSA